MDKTIWQESNSDRLIHQLYQTMRLFSKTLNQEIAKAKPDCGGRSMKKKYWNTK